MWPNMYAPKMAFITSRMYGVAYFDKDDVEIITVNTSDLPYELDDQGSMTRSFSCYS